MKNYLIFLFFILISVWGNNLRPFTNLDIIAFIILATYIIVTEIEGNKNPNK